MKNKRIAAIVASLGLAAMTYTAVPMSTNAAEDYTPVSGETYTFEKYLVMENDANVPNVSFDFTVTPAIKVNTIQSIRAVTASLMKNAII